MFAGKVAGEFAGSFQNTSAAGLQLDAYGAVQGDDRWSVTMAAGASLCITIYHYAVHQQMMLLQHSCS